MCGGYADGGVCTEENHQDEKKGASAHKTNN